MINIVDYHGTVMVLLCVIKITVVFYVDVRMDQPVELRARIDVGVNADRTLFSVLLRATVGIYRLLSMNVSIGDANKTFF